MAAKLKSSSSSSSSSPTSNLEISKKFYHFFILFLCFLFIFLAFANSTSEPSKPSSNMASTSFPSHEQTLLSDSSAGKTMNFRPRKRGKHKSKRGEFEASDHEVPSGPNPISNR